MPTRIVLMDTSFVLALENCDDPYHARAKQLDRELLEVGGVLVLHWGIILEIGDGFARIDRRNKGMQLLEKLQQEQGYRILPLTESLMKDATILYCARQDKNWSLTDCASFVIMTRERILEALTADAHFRQAGFNALLLD